LDLEQQVLGVVKIGKTDIISLVRRQADIIKNIWLAFANFLGRICIMIKKHLSSILLGTALLIISILSLFIGVMDIDLKVLLSGGNGMQLNIFLLSRIPRLLAILCTGVGMSVAGLIMQQLCMNKFVSPSTGATIQSAQFGILLSLVFLPAIGLWGRILLAFAMSILGTWIFVWFVQKIQFKSTVLVPLIGIMFGNVLGGITSFIAYKFDVTQQLSTYFVGSFALIIKGNYELVWLAVPLATIAFIFANYFNIVGMGKDFSRNLGVNYKLVLFCGLTIASMITASIVTIVGQISYIGLIVPNIVAMFKGDKIKGTLVDTALLGALFVLICDIIARSVIMPYELPIELIVGIIGSVMFIAMLIYKLNHGKKVIRLSKAKEGSCCG
jgi:iron complex transport system permease protein